jgi:hypothetical protein
LFTARFILASLTVSSVFSVPQTNTSRSAALSVWCWRMKSADCTNMPPEPQAGSKTLPPWGSMISVISLTTERGVKNSPPPWPSLSAKLARKYS